MAPYASALVSYFPTLRVTSVYRTYSQQVQLYNNWLAGRSKYPAAPPGSSYHEYGRAWDMVGDAAELARAGAVWESWGGTWGGRFGDEIHFQA